MSPSEKQHRLKIIIAFALVYVFWGSTYLAMRVAVMDIPALFMTGMRYLVAGPLMLAWCALNGKKVGINRGDFAYKLFLFGTSRACVPVGLRVSG